MQWVFKFQVFEFQGKAVHLNAQNEGLNQSKNMAQTNGYIQKHRGWIQSTQYNHKAWSQYTQLNYSNDKTHEQNQHSEAFNLHLIFSFWTNKCTLLFLYFCSSAFIGSKTEN